MSFVRCDGCGTTINTAGLEKVLGRASGGASSSFNLFDLKSVSPPLTCVHCGSTDFSPVYQPESSLPSSAPASESKESYKHHSTPPVSGEADGKRRLELNPTAVMLTIVGVVLLVVGIGLFRTLVTASNPSISRAVGGFAPRNSVIPTESTFHVGNLEWQLAPAAGLMDWQSAKIYCETLSLAGGGWRLPSRNELDLLYASKPLGNAAKPGMDLGSYWSSSSSGRSSVHAWLVNFHYGNTEVENVGNDNAVRCVR